jgi:hypothetical protein
MLPVVSALLAFVTGLFRSRASLCLEHLALRHQLEVYKHTVSRPRLRWPDRVFWGWLSRLWRGWPDALVFVQPRTVIAWQQQRFRDHWKGLSQRRTPGRPAITKEVRKLIQAMWQANPTWGSPRIVGELRKVGIEITKSLSEKFSGPKSDPGARDMHQRKIVLHLLLPADEQPPKAVHPGVRTLDYPAARPVAWDVALGLHFFAAASNVSGVAPRVEGVAHVVVVVPFVQAQVLRPRDRRFGALDHHGCQGGVDQFHIMAIGAVHGDCEWNTMAIGQHAPFGPKLPAIGRVLAHLFPHPAGPWSSPRP